MSVFLALLASVSAAPSADVDALVETIRDEQLDADVRLRAAEALANEVEATRSTTG